MHQWVVLSRCWVEGLEPKPKITDVQRRLLQAYTFWKETLHAPGPILYCRVVISYLCSVHLSCTLKVIISQPLRMLSLLQRLYRS